MDMKAYSKAMANLQETMTCIITGAGYISEKLYMLLQLYIQNKAWNSSFEAIQCFPEFKEFAGLPIVSQLGMIASRMALDGQGRLVLKANGKIIIPYEHFGSAVMLKHIGGPNGQHLGLASTLQAVTESYTIGKDQFGMEEEFIIQVIRNCPNPVCRFSPTPRETVKKNSEFNIPKDTHKPQVPNGSQSGACGPYPEFYSPLDLTLKAGVDENQNTSTCKFNNSPVNIVQKPIVFPDIDIRHKENSIKPDKTNFHRSPIKKEMGVQTEEHLEDTSEPSREENELIVKTFGEIVQNMAYMKSFIKPAMCKPYGKQSEALHKALVETIHLVQLLRSLLPPPHITVTSWKEEYKYRKGTKD